MTKKKPVKHKPRKSTAHPEARKDFTELVGRIGIMSVSTSAFAQQYGIPISTVHDWKMAYLKDFGVPNIEDVKRELSSQGDNLLRRFARTASNPDLSEEVKMKAAANFFKGSKLYTEMLESYGLKAKPKEEEDMPSVHINASDKDLYNLLTPEQRKKFAAMVGVKKEDG